MLLLYKDLHYLFLIDKASRTTDTRRVSKILIIPI